MKNSQARNRQQLPDGGVNPGNRCFLQDSTVTNDNGCYTDGFMKNRITASFIGKFRWVSEDKFVNPEDLYKTLTILPGEENTIVFDGILSQTLSNG